MDSHVGFAFLLEFYGDLIECSSLYDSYMYVHSMGYTFVFINILFQHVEYLCLLDVKIMDSLVSVLFISFETGPPYIALAGTCCVDQDGLELRGITCLCL